MAAWVEKETGLKPFLQECTVVVPRTASSRPFYVIAMESERHALAARLTHWRKFDSAGFWVGEDLTPTEVAERQSLTL